MMLHDTGSWKLSRASIYQVHTCLRRDKESLRYYVHQRHNIIFRGVATAAAFAATCMYGSWGIDRVNESLEDLQKRASDYLDGNPKAAAAVDQSRAKAQQLAEQANVLADKGVKALNKASEKAGKMFKKLW